MGKKNKKKIPSGEASVAATIQAADTTSVTRLPEPTMKTKAKKMGTSSEMCGNCGADEADCKNGLHACSQCKLVKYCCKDCQAQHWRKGGHKERCITPSQRTVAAASQPAQKLRSHDDSGENECSICLEALTGTLYDSIKLDYAGNNPPVETLPCAHRFHWACIDQMRRNGVTLEQVCPLCREPLPEIDEYFQAGLLVISRKQPTEAARLFELCLVQSPGHFGALHNLGTIMQVEGNAERAAQYFRKVLKMEPTHLATLTALSDFHYRKGEWKQCKKLAEQALQVDEKDPHAIELNGHVALQEKNFARALELYKHASEIAPHDPDNWYNTGLVILRHVRAQDALQLKEAEDALRRSVLLAPGELRSVLLLGACLQKVAAAETESLTLFEEAKILVAADENDAELFNLAQMLIDIDIGNNDHQDVMDFRIKLTATVAEVVEIMLRRASSLDSDIDYAMVLSSVLRNQQKYLEEAQVNFVWDIVSETRDEIDRLITKANKKGLSGNATEAERLLRQALELDMYDWKPLFTLGRFLIAEKKLGEAEILLRRSVAINTKFAGAYFQMGVCVFQLAQDESPAAEAFFEERVNSAEAAFKAAIAIDPHHIESWMFRGLNFQAFKGNPLAASKCFKNILRINPAHPTAGGYLESCLKGIRRQEANSEK